jgi:integrase
VLDVYTTGPTIYGVANGPTTRGLFIPGLKARAFRPLGKWPLWRGCEASGLNERIGWHVLRHTFASHLAMRGVALKVIQELLGHSDMKMTMRYAHLTPQIRHAAIELLDTE